MDFKKLLNDKENNKDSKEVLHDIEFNKLVKANTFLETETILFNCYSAKHYNGEVKELKLPILLYRFVNKKTLKVVDNVWLQFGYAHWEYDFTPDFYTRLMTRCTDESNSNEYGLCLDGGGECYISKSETVRILKECRDVLLKVGLKEYENI